VNSDNRPEIKSGVAVTDEAQLLPTACLRYGRATS